MELAGSSLPMQPFPPIVSGLLMLFVVAQPVLGIANRIVVTSEIRPDAPRSFRQLFWVKADDLTPWGKKAQRFFRIHWLSLAASFAILVAVNVWT